LRAAWLWGGFVPPGEGSSGFRSSGRSVITGSLVGVGPEPADANSRFALRVKMAGVAYAAFLGTSRRVVVSSDMNFPPGW
jgi:hypothetical protein